MSISRYVIFVVLLAALLAPPAASYGQPEGGDFEEISAVGRGPMSAPDPKKEALRDAMRAAVEQAVGVQVKGDTLVRDAELIRDKILVKSDGYVKEWKVLKEGPRGDLYEVEIKAKVGKGELNKDLFLNGIDVEAVYGWIGKPRIMVLAPDYVDGKEALTAFASSELEKIFKSKGITVLSGDQLKSIKQRDADLAFDNPDKARALGSRFGAEIVVVGKCISSFSRELDISGFKQVFYTSVLQARAYRTSNGEILMSETYSEPPGADTSAMGRFDASVRSIRNVVASNAQDIVYRVVKNWFEGMTKAQTYQVIISGVKGSEVSALVGFISDLPEVRDVFRRSLNRGTAELEVEYDGLQSALLEAIEGNTVLPLELVSEEPFRMSFEKAGKGTMSPKK